MPFVEVITRLLMVPAVESDTAQNRDSSGAHTRDSHALAAAAERVVQLVPLVLVITRLVPDEATAQNNDSSRAQTTDCH